MRWIPLEANPEFIRDFGVNPIWNFVDVYGLDAALLSMVPRPVRAVILLYPLTPACSTDPIGQPIENGKLLFIKQTIGNACGSIALLHSIMNNEDGLEFKDKSLVMDLLVQLRDKKPEERAALVESETRLSALHKSSAVQGQTEAPEASTNTNLHFICFVENSGGLYELDGRKDSPIYHGPCSSDTLLEDACDVIQKFMARDPENVNFAITALCRET